ncbi:MAG: preprotein translocase subunit YajC [Synergistaceae bacterium]
MGGQQGGLVGMMLPLAMFAAIFYFMIIRPQKKKQKAHEEMLASISRGSTIITAGGFFGIVREVLDDSYIIELDEGIKARILKSSVSMKKTDGGMDTKPKKKKLKKSETPSETAEESVKEAEVVEAEIEEADDTVKEEV